MDQTDKKHRQKTSTFFCCVPNSNKEAADDTVNCILAGVYFIGIYQKKQNHECSSIILPCRYDGRIHHRLDLHPTTISSTNHRTFCNWKSPWTKLLFHAIEAVGSGLFCPAYHSGMFCMLLPSQSMNTLPFMLTCSSTIDCWSLSWLDQGRVYGCIIRTVRSRRSMDL